MIYFLFVSKAVVENVRECLGLICDLWQAALRYKGMRDGHANLKMS